MTFGSGAEDILQKRRRAVLGIYHVARLAVELRDPLGELDGVRNGRREEDIAH